MQCSLVSTQIQTSLIGVWTYIEWNFSAPTPSQPIYLYLYIRTTGLHFVSMSPIKFCLSWKSGIHKGLIFQKTNTQHKRCENEECCMSFQKAVLRRAVRSNKERLTRKCNKLYKEFHSVCSSSYIVRAIKLRDWGGLKESKCMHRL